MTFEQLQLPGVDWDNMDQPAQYTIEIRKGPEFAEAAVLRSHKVKDPDDALGLIEGLRDTYHQREDVSWRDEEVDAHGMLYGIGRGGEVYVISCTPPPSVELS